LSCDGKAEFSAAITLNLKQSHNSSEIILICWFGAQDKILIILVLVLKTVVLLNIFVETMINQDYLINRKSRGTAFIWNICIYFFVTM